MTTEFAHAGIVAWTGYLNRIRWAWLVMFIIVWVWAFPVMILPILQQRKGISLAADHLRPAAISAGVVLKPGQRFGFHNLRHSLATFLINKEQDTKTVQGLLRHANVSTTLGLYAQSVNSSMVDAQESMLKAILRNGSDAVN
jgi:integrase